MNASATAQPTKKTKCAEELPLNVTKAKVEPNVDGALPKGNSRDEFRKLRRFHFGR
ncbi:hypothetical protein TELCIR_17878 [Teladorsagia circumcincta]|uniref:Uncharacterized protein n=1 Tax=Teladorsagia circumcincta TaxID=45464 RepID=A0A2G9TTN0_TELCI|nr:hypothetical protein TELCIR_17878 [Teladorsagia circumcincta]